MKEYAILGEYSLKSIKASEVPTRGKWKALAQHLIEQFDMMANRQVEVLNDGKRIKSKKELISLYDALKALIKRNKLTVDVMLDKDRLILVKDMRYFVK